MSHLFINLADGSVEVLKRIPLIHLSDFEVLIRVLRHYWGKHREIESFFDQDSVVILINRILSLIPVVIGDPLTLDTVTGTEIYRLFLADPAEYVQHLKPLDLPDRPAVEGKSIKLPSVDPLGDILDSLIASGLDYSQAMQCLSEHDINVIQALIERNYYRVTGASARDKGLDPGVVEQLDQAVKEDAELQAILQSEFGDMAAFF